MFTRLSWFLAVTMCCLSSGTTTAAERSSVEDREFDLVVVEATPGGIAMAVSAAREGLSVAMVNRTDHLGGILANGLGVWDTQYEGRRSPIYDEVRQGIFNYYRKIYGENSPQYREALPGKSGHTNGKFEARVAEAVFSDLVAREKNITVLKGLVPAAVERDGALVRAIAFNASSGGKPIRIKGKAFADCTYEGDVAALARVPYRVGREARNEFDEPHAGVVFMRQSSTPPNQRLAQARSQHDLLNLRKHTGFQEIILPQSTGAADGNVQAFNYRTILSSNPTNRLPVVKPAGYHPEFLQRLEFGSIVQPLPNDKICWNRPQLVGPHSAYVEGDWKTRLDIMEQHWQATMGLLYFLQNDPSVPEERRKYFQRYGLARDEFTDHRNRPHEIYVREARRIVGRYIFTQHDAMLASGMNRAPVHQDSIAFTEWYMDTHACTTNRAPGSMDEGKMMLHYETFPGQVPYRTLLPRGIDNLLVPVCLSATHVAWGTIRLEPTWMQIGESAGLAVAVAKKDGVTPARIQTDKLIRQLSERRSMVAFFNDVNIRGSETWIPMVQYFATRGFFSDYNARMGEGLKHATAKVWAEGLQQLRAGNLDANALARKVAAAEVSPGRDITEAEFAALLPETPETRTMKSKAFVTREEAVRTLWQFAR